MKHRCPICKKIVKEISAKKNEETKFFPFCSQRCKLIDLGSWLETNYKIACETSEDLENNALDND